MSEITFRMKPIAVDQQRLIFAADFFFWFQELVKRLVLQVFTCKNLKQKLVTACKRFASIYL